MGYSLEQPKRSDTPAITDLINAHSQALVGTRRALIDKDGDLRTARYIPGAAEQIIIRDTEDRNAGHAWWFSRSPYVVVEMGLTIHPDYWPTDITDALLDYIESNVRTALDLSPNGARVVLQIAALADDAPLIARLEDRHFAPAREWVHFEVTLTEPTIVNLPDGITIREMDPRFDWPAVGAVMDAAFADHWGEMGPHVRTLLEEDEAEYASEALPEDGVDGEVEDDPFSNSLGLCFVAEAAGMVIGSCLCNAQTVEWPDSGKLGSLSVLREYRRQGVGHALTATALTEFYRRGIRRVITDTDIASFTGANRLYPRFGFRPYRYERVYEKELRPGLEWRALSPSELQP